MSYKHYRSGDFLFISDTISKVFRVGDLTDEHKIVADAVKKFCEAEVFPKEISEAIENKDSNLLPRLIKKLGKLGYLGFDVPIAYGGGGMDKVAAVLVSEVLAGDGSLAVTYRSHSGIGTLPIVYYGTEEQKRKYLPRLVNGELIAAYALTEAEAGSDANSGKTTAVLENGHYILNGTKVFITNSRFADIFIVFAKLGGELSAFIVEKSFAGVSIGREEQKMGICGSSTASVFFENVPVPVDNLLGKLGKGLPIALTILNVGRLKLAATCLGASKAVLKNSTEYAVARKQFGRNIGEFGLIRQKLAKMSAYISAMEAVVYRTAGLMDNALNGIEGLDQEVIKGALSEHIAEYSMIKVFCSEALSMITDENVQIHGGNGFTMDYPAARFYLDSRVNRIFLGTNEINTLVAIKALLKKQNTALEAVSESIIDNRFPKLPVKSNTRNLLDRLNQAKAASIVVSGVVLQKLRGELTEHQIILGLLADCFIPIYVMDSILSAIGEDPDVISEARARLIFADMFANIEKSIQRILSSVADNNGREITETLIKKIMEHRSDNYEFLCNTIALDLL